MAAKPETLMWNRLKAQASPDWHITRIENRHGGGVPDVHICAQGLAFWLELKTTKNQRINIGSHQVAWHYGFSRAGGVSFFLVEALPASTLFLFGGNQGKELLVNGLRTTSSGLVVPCLWSGPDGSGAWDHMIRVGSNRSYSAGSGSGRASIGYGLI